MKPSVGFYNCLIFSKQKDYLRMKVSRDAWGMYGVLQSCIGKFSDLFNQDRQMICNGIPDNQIIDGVITVYQDISKTNNAMMFRHCFKDTLIGYFN